MDKIIRIEYTVKAVAALHARRIFQLASDRLLNVHGWKHLSNCLFATSEHRDAKGIAVCREARSEDYLNVTYQDRRLFGWMRVEYIMELPQDNGAELVMLFRPVDLPFAGEKLRGHETRPALLRVVRRGLEVTAGLMVETSSASSVFDRIGAHVVQWRSLVNGILNDLLPLDDRFNDPTLALDASGRTQFQFIVPDN